ncbi:MAG: ferritin-like domain-containing protein [Parachlamydiaceae bacterium]|nr:ferritin-like domain-containing protein [Parachlamydiaceae bacterium]
MTSNAFFEMFLDLLRDIFNAENQIISALPKVIKAASNPELKEALTSHLEETKNQVDRLKKIFKTLNENPTGEKCSGMEGIIDECSEALELSNSSPTVKDAALIIGCQKVEHYEIASYGSARALARHLNDSGISDRIDFDEIADILQQTLDEESDADEKLTEIAEGGFFTKGINEEAERDSLKTKMTKTKAK